MSQPQSSDIPQPRDPPLPEEILEKLEPNRCYMVADVVAEFESQYDPNRGTIRNRLEYLVNEENIERRKHENDAVTYRKPPDSVSSI